MKYSRKDLRGVIIKLADMKFDDFDETGVSGRRIVALMMSTLMKSVMYGIINAPAAVAHLGINVGKAGAKAFCHAGAKGADKAYHLFFHRKKDKKEEEEFESEAVRFHFHLI